MPASGAKLWAYPTGDAVSATTVANGMVYAGSGTGYVYAFGLPGGGPAVKRPAVGRLRPDYALRPLVTGLASSGRGPR